MNSNGNNCIKVRVQALIKNPSDKSQILLVKHKKGNKEYWVLPGGTLEYRESLEECLKRELNEELNIKNPKIKKFLTLKEFIPETEDRHIIDVYYYVEIEETENIGLNEDPIVKDWKFVDINTFLETVYPSKEFLCSLIEMIDG